MNATPPDPLLHSTTYTYDANGNVLSVTDANSKVTTYAHNNRDLLTSVTDAASGVTSFGYDAAGNLTSKTNTRSTSFRRPAPRCRGRLACPVEAMAGHLAPGSEAPAFRGTDLSGATFDSRSFAGAPSAVLFVSPNCSSCAVTLQELDALSWKVGGRLVVVCRAELDECASMVERYRVDAPIIPDVDNKIGLQFGITAVPMAVLVDASGQVQSYGFPGGGTRELDRMFVGASPELGELKTAGG